MDLFESVGLQVDVLEFAQQIFGVYVKALEKRKVLILYCNNVPVLLNHVIRGKMCNIVTPHVIRSFH